MTLYVKGEGENFWHFCKNCKKYPSDIVETTEERPTRNLCPECYENENKDDCEGEDEVSFAFGSAVRGSARR